MVNVCGSRVTSRVRRSVTGVETYGLTWIALRSCRARLKPYSGSILLGLGPDKCTQDIGPGPLPVGVRAAAREAATAHAAAGPSATRTGARAARDRAARGAPAPSAVGVLGGAQVEEQEQDEKESLRTRGSSTVER